MDTVIKLELRADNNYTLRNEQNLLVEKWDNPTVADAAIAIDMAANEAIERRGYSGIGAGALILAVFDDGTSEEIYLDDIAHYNWAEETPRKSIRRRRQFVSATRKNGVWDGHNHIKCSFRASKALLWKLREEREPEVMI